MNFDCELNKYQPKTISNDNNQMNFILNLVKIIFIQELAFLLSQNR